LDEIFTPLPSISFFPISTVKKINTYKKEGKFCFITDKAELPINMNLFKLFSFYAFVLLTAAAVTVAQVPIFPFPPNDGTKSYYVTGENGVNIFVEEKGDPKKTTILFSSGYLTSRISWDPQWTDPELHKKFHLVRYDYRGIANSDKPMYADSYSIELHAADLSAIIGKLSSDYDFEKKKIVLVGWSIGTPVSLTFMKTYPGIKIAGFVSICGLVNNTATGDPDPRLVTIFKDLTDPQEIYSKVVYAFEGLFNITTFKTLSNEVAALFMGIYVKAPFQYRTMSASKYNKYFLFFKKRKEKSNLYIY
jgi:pimeloyl-ACP methyl ester carboxylesterase